MNADTIKTLARELQQARATRTPLRHFSQRFPEMTVADGYAIQTAWVALEIAAGRTVRGHKIGLTSRAMQLSALRDFQWDPTLTGRRSSLPQKNRMRVRKLSKLRNPRALALMV